VTAPVLAAPPCPDWCRGVCQNCNNQCSSPVCSLWHQQEDTVIHGINLQTDGYEDELNFAEVGLGRQDTAGKPGDVYVCLDLQEHGLHLTPNQARELAATLNRLADQGENQ
jgi:uncharacterized protein DUF6907